MRLVIFYLIVLASFFTASAQELVWSDEFDGTVIDANKWDKPEYNRRQNSNGPDGWWLREDSFLDGNGHLIIRARQIANRNSDNDPYDYATGAIRSIGKFEQKFGKFEIRCRLPKQPGWWVAYWLYSQSVGNEDGSGEDGTEIDIFEGFGWTDKMQHALHWDGYGDAHQSIGHSLTMENLREGFHTFTLEWYENLYVFYVDGMESWRTDAGGVSKVPAYVKVTGELSTESWAVGTNWSNDPTKATWPDSFIVDYVRVYKLDETTFNEPDPKDHLAYRKTATSSTDTGTRYLARRAVDGSITSRWQSEPGQQWLMVDLEESYLINKVKLSWADLYGTEYKIETSESADGPWIECIHVTDHDGNGAVTHEFTPQAGRFIRMNGLKSVDDAGFSLWEMAVYGDEKSDVKKKDKSAILPDGSILLQNYPNPFNPSTTFSFQTPGGQTRLAVYNVHGQHVALLLDEIIPAGEHSVHWNAEAFPSSIYLVRLQTEDGILTRKILLQK